MARWQIQALTEPVSVPPPVVYTAETSCDVYITEILQHQYQGLASTPTAPFPERVQVDKFAPILPAYRFARPPNNVGESYFKGMGTVFPESVSVDRWIGSKPDVLFRAPPLRWHDMFAWDPNKAFPETVTVDRWIGQRPDYIFRRPPNNVGEPFSWDNFLIPSVFVMRTFVSYPDFLFRRPPNNVGDYFFWNPNKAFPETVTVDRWIGQKPDLIFRRPPNNVGDASFWDPAGTNFSEVVSIDRFAPIYPNLFLRIPPKNVGDALFWGELETAPEPEIGYAYYPDYLFRRPPNNVGEPLSWNPNVKFQEVIAADKWTPIYPSYIWRLPRLNEYPALAFWGINTPKVTVTTPQLLFDIDHKRFYLQVTKPASGAPYIKPM